MPRTAARPVDSQRQFHPWITFKATDVNSFDPKLWTMLGEARSKCQHLAGVPLQPSVAQHLYEVTLIKGAQATTAIEGNTLTEEQVAGILNGTFTAPPSRAYQEREVKNVLEALMNIDNQIMSGGYPRITKDLICGFNEQLLEGTKLEPHVLPGQVRDYSVGVASYRGAPPKTAPTSWTNSPNGSKATCSSQRIQRSSTPWPSPVQSTLTCTSPGSTLLGTATAV